MVQLERQGPGHNRILAFVYRQKMTSKGFKLSGRVSSPVNPTWNQPWKFTGGLKLKPKPKLQYFGHLIRRANSLEKTLMLGKIEGKRRGRQRMSWLDSITDSMNLSKLWESGGQRRRTCYSPWGHKELDMTERLNNYYSGSRVKTRFDWVDRAGIPVRKDTFMQ